MLQYLKIETEFNLKKESGQVTKKNQKLNIKINPIFSEH